ncbi:very short patch repair endonuclease [Pseudomonas sp. GM24]|uniref:very short patch repair endonuclease n=2 Tax=unclassified Pseudomonas TaxID=196821 RepID=UPI002379E5C9|nr:very short patch repair endonuclease [Pseudomonas sp. GM24]
MSKATRSRMMSGIKGKNTKPELMLRRYLHSKGFRFRIHEDKLPGRPDVVLKKYGVVVLVHGCFWHRHKNCFYATEPNSRKDFWSSKFSKNTARDESQVLQLLELGWRVLVVWECGSKNALDDIGQIDVFIKGDFKYMEWPSTPKRIRVS